MRRFLTEIAFVMALGTILLCLAVIWRTPGAAPRQSADTDEIMWDCHDERLKPTTPMAVGGNGRLCFSQFGTRTSLEADNLVPGELDTAWMAYIETPAVCSATPCSLPELMRLSPPVPIARFDSTIADDTRRATMASSFKGLTLAPSAQVQLLLVSHGPVVMGEGRPRQLLGAPWPGVMRDGPTGAGVIARTHFPIRWGWD